LPQVDWLIKWNPRSTNVQALAQSLTNGNATMWTTPRQGKRLTLWEQSVTIEGVQRPVRRVLRLIERTIDAKGQMLLGPDYTLEGWTTTLPKGQFDAQAIIDLYADHGTHEQFHPEFKSTPWGGHPLFTSYVKAALDQHLRSAAHGTAEKAAA